MGVLGLEQLSRHGRLPGMTDAEPVSETDPLDIAPQLSELLALEDGWLDGAGRAPERFGILWLATAFQQGFPGDAPRPHLYPTETGGVLAEWTCGAIEVSLEVDLEARTGIWATDGMERRASEERQLNLTTAESWEWLSAQIGGPMSGR